MLSRSLMQIPVTPPAEDPRADSPEPAATALSALLDKGAAARAHSRKMRLLWGAGMLAVVVAGGGYELVQKTQEPAHWVNSARVVEVKTKPGDPAGPGHTNAADAAAATGVSPQHLRQRERRASSADEAQLLDVYGLLASGEGEQALLQAKRLAADAPAFGLGHLLYADLLNAQAQPVTGFGAAPADWAARARDRLDELTDEARARVQGAALSPVPGTVPAPFVSLAPSVKHAVAVDVSRSRVYLIENGPQGPTLIREYYASIGKNGMVKQLAGDQRTPLGVYFVTREVPPARLAPRYGKQALVLNYPNPYDRLQGREGDGIWLHGVPANLYSRAPMATDGCIALANPYLAELAGFIEAQGTPIVIAEHLEWATPADLRQRHAEFIASFDRWRAARDQADPLASQAFYSTTVQLPEAEALGPPWRQQLRDEQQQRQQKHPGAAAPPIDRLSIVSWQDRQALMVVTFSEAETGEHHARTRRQYWLQEGGTWRIFYERSLV